MLKCLSVSYIMQDKQISSDVNQMLYNISPVIVKCGMGEGGHIQCIWEVIIIEVIYPYTYVCSLYYKLYVVLKVVSSGFFIFNIPHLYYISTQCDMK